MTRAHARVDAQVSARCEVLSGFRGGQRRLLMSYDLPGVLPPSKAVVFTAALRAGNRFVCSQARSRGMK